MQKKNAGVSNPRTNNTWQKVNILGSVHSGSLVLRYGCIGVSKVEWKLEEKGYRNPDKGTGKLVGLDVAFPTGVPPRWPIMLPDVDRVVSQRAANTIGVTSSGASGLEIADLKFLLLQACLFVR
jgi:hypothetical protein